MVGLVLSAALSLLVDVAFTVVLNRKFKELVEEGYSPVFPFALKQFDRFQMPVPGDKRGMLSLVAGVVAFWPMLEETVFRVVPFMVAGLPGALLGTLMWSVSHAVKFHQYNVSLPEREYWSFLKVYIAGLTAAGAVWSISIPLSETLWAPYLFHVAHNASAVVYISRSISVPRKGFVKAGQPRSATRRVAGSMVYVPKYSGRVRFEYLD